MAKMMPFFESFGNVELYAGLSDFQASYGALLRQLFEVTHHPDTLHTAIQVYTQAIESANKLNHVSRIAEAHWNIAIIQDSLNHYSAAARSFQEASENFIQAAHNIPMLREFYHDHATYMNAWKEIAHAKAAHQKREYDVAAQHYDTATTLHKATTRWNYLSANYEAWAHLERAENYSRNNEPENAKQHFNTATHHFTHAHQCIQQTIPTIDLKQLQEFLAQLLNALTLRHKYTTNRITIEDARLADKQGEHGTAAELYSQARIQLTTLLTTLTREADRQEIQPLIDLCHAWELMSRAEAEADPPLFLQATEFFDQAKKHSLHEQDRLLALGHSAFCRALDAGMRFEATREITTYAQAKKHLETAQNYYVKANIPNATEYATATDRLFDAYIYMDNANTEFDPRKKAQYYQIAQKLLHAAIDAYQKARHPEKVDQVARLLQEVVEEHRLALSLTEVLHTPILTSTASFSTPTPRLETAMGIEQFDRVTVQSYLTGPPEAMIGDTLDLQLDLINVGKNVGVLLQVEAIIPHGCKVIQVPRQYPLLPGGLDLRGWKIEPLKVISIPFTFKVQVTGRITISPQITYVDDIGRIRSCHTNPISIQIHPQLTFEFNTRYAPQIFTYLIDAFIEDYMQRQLPLDHAGWRTLMQLVKHSNVPKSRVYGVRRGKSAIHELRFRGLIEERIFTGERGRGGRILRIRILFTNEVVKRYVEQQVMKNREQ
jgi:hypothetical protein